MNNFIFVIWNNIPTGGMIEIFLNQFILIIVYALQLAYAYNIMNSSI